jgi:hypothetical protein
MRNVELRPRDSELETKHTSIRLLLLLVLVIWWPTSVFAQKVVDKMVATVDSGGSIDLITYSDVLWQVALQPSVPLDNPSSEELNRALNLIINQRLILQEAEKLPAVAPTDKEIEGAKKILYNLFPSRTEFQSRVDRVGLSNDQIREILRQRLVIEKYLDFRFRSFVVVTLQEVADYYRDVFVPRFRRTAPGRIVPTLEEVRSDLEKSLTEDKIEADTDAFIESARERSEITILSQL